MVCTANRIPLGSDGKLYYGQAGGDCGSATTLAACVQDVTIPAGSNLREITSRNHNGNKSEDYGLQEFTIQFGVLENEDGAADLLDQLTQAKFSRLKIPMMALTDTEANDGRGPDGLWVVESMDNNQPVGDSMGWAITLKLNLLYRYVGHTAVITAEDPNIILSESTTYTKYQVIGNVNAKGPGVLSYSAFAVGTVYDIQPDTGNIIVIDPTSVTVAAGQLADSTTISSNIAGVSPLAQAVTVTVTA